MFLKRYILNYGNNAAKGVLYMKKFLLIALAAAMIFATGCAENLPEPDPSESPENQAEPASDAVLPAAHSVPSYTSETVSVTLGDTTADLTLFRDLYGEIYHVSSKNKVIKLSDSELIIAADDPEIKGMTQLYLVDLGDMSARPLLPEELSGHTAAEFSESITAKYTLLSWCEGCVLNGERGSVEKPTLAYYSNKYCNGDLISNSSNCNELGAIWLFDLSSSKEIRIAPPEGYDVNANDFKWLNDSTLLFTAFDPKGNEFYFTYDINTCATEMMELDDHTLTELLRREADFYNLTHYIGNLDEDELLIDEPSGMLINLKNDPFNGDFEAFLAEEDEIYTEDWQRYSTEQDGKIYLSLPEGPHETEYHLNIMTIQRYDPEAGSIDVRAWFIPHEGDKLTLHTRLTCWYTIVKTPDGWRISYADRNMVPYFDVDYFSDDAQAPVFMCVDDDPFEAFDKKPDISTDEIINLLMNRQFIMWNEGSSLSYGTPGVEFNLSDPANYVERMLSDGQAYPFYEVSDPVFADAESWYGLIDATFGDELADKYREFEYYADIDGKLYTTGFEGGNGVIRQNAVWQVTEADENSFTVRLLTGGYGECDTSFYAQEVVFKKSGGGWRIEAESFEQY